MKNPDIGSCVYVLFHKLWGKTLVGGRLRSEAWWRRRLEQIINEPTYVIPPEHLWDGKPVEPRYIPYEVEFNLSNASDCVEWFKQNQVW